MFPTQFSYLWKARLWRTWPAASSPWSHCLRTFRFEPCVLHQEQLNSMRCTARWQLKTTHLGKWCKVSKFPSKFQSENFVANFEFGLWLDRQSLGQILRTFGLSGSSRSFWSSTIVQCECTCRYSDSDLKHWEGQQGIFFQTEQSAQDSWLCMDFGFSQPTSQNWDYVSK